MGIPLPALSIRPPEQQESPVQSIGQLLQLKNAVAQGQTTQLQQEAMRQENAQRDLALKNSQAMTATFKNWDGKNWDDIPTMFVKNGGSGDAALNLKKGILETQTKEAALTKDKVENLQSQNDAVMEAHKAVDAVRKAPGATPDAIEAAYQQQRTNLAKVPGLDMNTIPPQYPGDQAFEAAGAGLTGTSARLQALARMKASEKQPEGEKPLTNLDQMNQALTSRFQVLNPGKTLPPQFTLPANATQKDYDRIDKALESTEKAVGTKAQQDTANAMREQAAQLARQNREDRLQNQQDREEKDNLQPVTGTDKNGKAVLVSAGDAKKMGLTGTMKADADIVNKSTAARHWLPLAEKTTTIQRVDPKDPKSAAANPEDMGILQLVDDLDKRGKLGPLASRYNDFIAGKWGAGDPEYAALRTKMGLSTTKLMQAHVGSRGGAFMMEHFQDLANAKKMDAGTLKAGIRSEVNYMRDVAMMPDSEQAPSAKQKPPLSSFEK